MNTNLLRSWLNLPPGPWPPDDRTLLGFGNGPVSPQAAERQAMLLIGKLRPHQLVHPELVTEGMNRLAQAMLSITTSATPVAPAPVIAAPVAATAVPAPVVQAPVVPAPTAPAVVTKQPPPPDAAPVAPGVALPGPAQFPETPVEMTPPPFVPVDLSPVPTSAVSKPAPSGTDQPPSSSASPSVVLDAEVIGMPPEPVPAVRVHQVESPIIALSRPEPPPPLSIPIPDVEPPTVPVGMSLASRRLAYRELVALRQLMKAWDQLRPFFANPSEKAETPGRVFALLEAIEQFRGASEHDGLDWEEVEAIAPRVAAIGTQPAILPVFRVLLPSQRQLLARDWAVGKAHFEAMRIGLRKSLRASRPGVTINRAAEIALNGLGHNPEWFLGLSSLVVLCVAGIRIMVR